MMTLTPHFRGSCWSALLGGLVIALLAGPVLAGGDNDPVGDLPKSEDGAATNEATALDDTPTEGMDEPTLADGGLVDASDGRAATLRVHVDGMELLGSPDGGQTLEVQIDPTADASLMLPEDVVMAQAFLVLDEAAQGELGALLSGQVQTQAVLRTELAEALDLEHFARLAAKHLPDGWSATWVVHSIDSHGVSHLAAARVSADGHLTEVAID